MCPEPSPPVRHHDEGNQSKEHSMKYMMFVCTDAEPDADKENWPDIEAWVAENDGRGRPQPPSPQKSADMESLHENDPEPMVRR
jgi:hypothetical protein